jgi:hypothetical protein
MPACARVGVLTDTERALLVAAIPAAATILVAVLAALAAYLSSKRDRRRGLYSEAVRAALAWQEQLYRVRRRGADQERALTEPFHELQEQLTYYEAWIGSESKYLCRSFGRLVKTTKQKTEPLIKEAWRAEVGADWAGAETPELSEATASFLADVRSHLSPWPWRRCAAAWRNRKDT